MSDLTAPPQQPAPVNTPVNTPVEPWFQIEYPWRRVTEQRRSPV